MMDERVKKILELAVANKASDVHLIGGNISKLRVSGTLMDLAQSYQVSTEELDKMILSMLSEGQREKLSKEKEIDFSLEVVGARYRVNVYHQKGTLAVAFRVIPMNIPQMESLNLPEILKSFLELKQGFVLITGPTGHGKSTTLASMLDRINEHRACHIVTIEDPVEYLINPKKSIISQRELGTDFVTFDNALRATLRQDPNVVLVGEMRDLETIRAAMTVAETGHLVFSTLHTNSASQTIDRVIDVFPEGEKEQIRIQLASVLTAVISQRLVPTVEGKLIPAFEIMIANSAVRNTIRESKSFMVDNIISTSADLGMMSLETSLASLVKQGVISDEEALRHCLRPEELQSRLRERILKNG